MAVLYAERRDTKRSKEDAKKKEIIDTYIIKVESGDEPATILISNFSDLPKIGDPHPVDNTVICKGRSISATESRLIWLMEVTYDDASEGDGGGGGGGGGAISVLAVDLGVWEDNFIQDYRLDGPGGKPGPLVATNDEPIKFEASRPQVLLTITALTDNPRLGDLVYAVNCVNKQRVTWLGMSFEPGQLMFADYNANNSGGTVWTEKFVFKGKIYQSPEDYDNGAGVRIGGWQPFILNAGLVEWIQNDDGELEYTPIRPLEKEGGTPASSPVTSPWPLNQGGKAITRDRIKDDRVFLNPKMYSDLDFGLFNFDFASLLSREKRRQLGL